MRMVLLNAEKYHTDNNYIAFLSHKSNLYAKKATAI